MLSSVFRTACAELARDNITVTTVCPGLMRTGSPVNAFFKGHFDAEYAWFAISDGLPGSSIAAERAARQIIDASRKGQAQLVITLKAKLAVLGFNVLPELSARLLELVNSMLPGPRQLPAAPKCKAAGRAARAFMASLQP